MTKKGIEVGETRVLAFVEELLGRKYVTKRNGETTLEKQWGRARKAVPLQLVVEVLYSFQYTPCLNIHQSRLNPGSGSCLFLITI